MVVAGCIVGADGVLEGPGTEVPSGMYFDAGVIGLVVEDVCGVGLLVVA